MKFWFRSLSLASHFFELFRPFLKRRFTHTQKAEPTNEKRIRNQSNYSTSTTATGAHTSIMTSCIIIQNQIPPLSNTAESNCTMASPYPLPLPLPQHQQQQQQWPDRMANVMCNQITARVEEMLKGSRLNRNTNQHIALIRPEFDFVSVDGKPLGSGSFSQVTAVTTRDGRRYALKHLKRSLMDRQEEFQLAAAELACEAHILSSLDHPNILKIKGWAENGIASFENGKHNSFFLMLDLLDETLNQRIERWRDEQEHYDLNSMAPVMAPQHQQPSFWRRRVSRSPDAFNTVMVQQQLQQHADHMRYQALYLDKIRIMKEIASALDYIHSNGIIFRGKKERLACRLYNC